MIEDDREKILASIRRGLRGTERPSAGRSAKSPLLTEPDADFASRFAHFKAELSALGGEAATAGSETDLADIVTAKKTGAIFVYDDIRTGYGTFTSLLTESREARFGLEFGRGYDKREAASFESAVTGCVACIAETGSAVIKTDMRLPAALATSLFVVAEERQLLGSLDELFTDRFGNFEGSNLLLITGPSRTADIEKELVTGVHGPKEVTVVFVQR